MNLSQSLNALKIANQSPRCGARTRKVGNPHCLSPAMPNGRCRMHGGKSTGAPKGSKHGRYTHGFYTQEAKAQRKWLKEFIRESDKLIEYINQ